MASKFYLLNSFRGTFLSF